MLDGDTLVWPKRISILLSVIFSLVFFFLSQISPIFGYLLALLTLIMMIIASLVSSYWPTENKKENLFVFSVLWGLILGVVVPFLIGKFLDDGFQGIFDMIMRPV